MPRIPDKCRLLHGLYQLARLYIDDRADCLMRGTVVVTSWTDARKRTGPGAFPFAPKTNARD